MLSGRGGRDSRLCIAEPVCARSEFRHSDSAVMKHKDDSNQLHRIEVRMEKYPSQ